MRTLSALVQLRSWVRENPDRWYSVEEYGYRDKRNKGFVVEIGFEHDNKCFNIVGDQTDLHIIPLDKNKKPKKLCKFDNNITLDDVIMEVLEAANNHIEKQGAKGFDKTCEK